MNTIEVDYLSKSFGSIRAVEEVSFAVEQGEIFGLLGPNGAGKTTTIRILLDIIRPDHGRVSILGGAMSEEKKSRIGYLPEERGLYQDDTLEHGLVYLATLKGIPKKIAQARLNQYLERFELMAYKGKKVKELSKGMQQKAQVINTILHHPELIIIDEPFTALDPVNVQLIKDLILELRSQGVTIIMSTHQMHLVEELCERILLIHKGQNVLYGNLIEIQKKFMGHAVLVRASSNLPKLPGVQEIQSHNNSLKLILEPQISAHDILSHLVAQHVPLEKFEIAIPSLDEIFIQVVEGAQSV